MPDWINAEIIGNHEWTDNLFSLRFRAPLGEFKAGQFVRLAMEIDGEIVARPYSLVNSPTESELEVFFNIIPQGPLTPRLAELKPGDFIKVADKPYGFLTVEEIPDARDLWMLASGTGVGPFISILKSGNAWRKFENVVLVYSVKTARELAYQHVIAEIGTQYQAQLSFVPVVTRERIEGALNQRITAALESGVLEQTAGIRLSADDSHVMMCGNSAMIADVTELLKARNMRKHLRREPGHITTEKYH
ncbi:MAG: ferredoxin--NADP reductase [Gammaproteobacteria bacterium]|jgi:ferredoxin--NADP+ reductase